MPEPKPTRGFGLLEGFLAGKRSRMADRLIPPGHRDEPVLDIGCGSHPVFLLNTQFNQKFGLDKAIEESVCETLKEVNITLVNAEIEAEGTMPFEGDFFSVVTMLAVIEHLEKRRLVRLFAEIHRILRPGGLLIVTTPAVWTGALLRAMARLRLVSAVEIEEHKECYAPSRIYHMLEQAGFEGASVQHGYFELFANSWVMAKK